MLLLQMPRSSSRPKADESLSPPALSLAGGRKSTRWVRTTAARRGLERWQREVQGRVDGRGRATQLEADKDLPDQVKGTNNFQDVKLIPADNSDRIGIIILAPKGDRFSSNSTKHFRNRKLGLT